MRRTLRCAMAMLIVCVCAVGCGQNAAAPAIVTVSTTVTDIKALAEVQTAIVAPPAEVQTVTTTSGRCSPLRRRRAMESPVSPIPAAPTINR